MNDEQFISRKDQFNLDINTSRYMEVSEPNYILKMQSHKQYLESIYTHQTQLVDHKYHKQIQIDIDSIQDMSVSRCRHKLEWAIRVPDDEQ